MKKHILAAAAIFCASVVLALGLWMHDYPLRDMGNAPPEGSAAAVTARLHLLEDFSIPGEAQIYAAERVKDVWYLAYTMPETSSFRGTAVLERCPLNRWRVSQTDYAMDAALLVSRDNRADCCRVLVSGQSYDAAVKRYRLGEASLPQGTADFFSEREIPASGAPFLTVTESEHYIDVVRAYDKDGTDVTNAYFKTADLGVGYTSAAQVGWIVYMGLLAAAVTLLSAFLPRRRREKT